MTTVFKPLIIASSIVFLTACGGGGGSSDDDDNDNDPGNSEELAIDTSNAKGITIDAYRSAYFTQGATDFVDLTAKRVAGKGVSVDEMSFNEKVILLSGFRDTTVVDCAEGGTITLTFTDALPEGASAGDSFDINADNCSNGISTQNGGVSFEINSFSETDASFTFSYNNLNITSGSDTVNANGSITMSVSDNGTTETISITSSQLSISYNSDVVTLTNYSVIATLTGFTATLDADYTITTPEGSVTVTTDPRFEGPTFNACPIVGTMTISGSDGTSVSLNADTGNANTMLLTINNGSSVTTDTIVCSELL
ncbi:MAG: hypothetical protein AAF434_14845 [Pseudomonadota bacterium]